MGNHEKQKLVLRTVGIVLLVVGLICALIGFIDIFSTISRHEMSTKFYLAIIGLPLMGIGGGLTLFSFQREISRYVKDETMPVLNEAGKEIAPAVRAVANAVRGKTEEVSCPHCGEQNPAENTYCKACGKPLVRKCPRCGAELSPDSAYCGKCGTKL